MLWQYHHIPVVVGKMPQPTDSLLGLQLARTLWQLHRKERVPLQAMRYTKAAAARQMTYPEHLHTIDACAVKTT